MKKIMLSLITGVLVMTQLDAQIEQGAILIGGSLSFNTSSSESVYDDGTTTVTTENPTYTDMSIMPWFGYMITDDFMAGLGIGFGSTKEEYSYVDNDEATHEVTNKTTMTTIAPGVRYYYAHFESMHLFAQLGIPIGFGSITTEDVSANTTVSTESDISSFGVGISPGVAININERCMLEVTYGNLGFSSTSVTTQLDPGSIEVNSTGFGLDWANTFGFGITFAL